MRVPPPVPVLIDRVTPETLTELMLAILNRNSGASK